MNTAAGIVAVVLLALFAAAVAALIDGMTGRHLFWISFTALLLILLLGPAVA